MPTIRDARVDDCDPIVELVCEFKVGGKSPSDPAGVRGAAMACIDLPEHDLLVADHEGDVVGYVAVHWVPFPLIQGCEGYISDLLVRPDWRGRGVGTLLLRAVEDRAKASGVTRLMLQNRMARESFERGFFRKAGFDHRDDVANFVKAVDS